MTENSRLYPDPKYHPELYNAWKLHLQDETRAQALELVEALANNKKIDAIKALRSLVGRDGDGFFLDLREAKDKIEAITGQYQPAAKLDDAKYAVLCRDCDGDEWRQMRFGLTLTHATQEANDGINQYGWKDCMIVRVVVKTEKKLILVNV